MGVDGSIMAGSMKVIGIAFCSCSHPEMPEGSPEITPADPSDTFAWGGKFGGKVAIVIS